MIQKVKEFVSHHLPWPILTLIFSLKRRRFLKAASHAQRKLCEAEACLRAKPGPIRVAFLVRGASDCLLKIFRLMQADEAFDPRVVVIPFVNFPGADTMGSYEKGVDYFERELGSSYVCPILAGSQFADVTGDFDLFITDNAYDKITTEPYRTLTLAGKGKPVVQIRYFCDSGSKYISGCLDWHVELLYLWRLYVENAHVMARIEKRQALLKKFDRLRVVGAPKVDELAAIPILARTRKRIILAPHHSIVKNNMLWQGNFPKYQDFIASLPKCYPQIDWVYRPHPLLHARMVAEGLWTEVERQKFEDKMTSYTNVEYQRGGSYYEAFMNSDGMIQDCGSFLPEYFYTGKPQCFVLRKPGVERKQYDQWGQALLSHVYRAYGMADITQFIENVILKGKDVMADARIKFANAMKCNYPHSSEAIVTDIKRALGRA